MRAEFSKRTKIIAWNRAGGKCENCSAKLYPGKFHYHHEQECAFDGTSELDNCRVLCIACHSAITRNRARAIAKSNRQRAKHIGIKKPRSIRGWKKFDGTPVFASRTR